MIRKLIRAALYGVAFLVGVAGIGLSIEGLQAVVLFTGPAGTTSPQLAYPQNQGDYNAILNATGLAGTGTPQISLGVSQIATSVVASTTGGNATTTFLQFMQMATYTTTTGAGTGKCNMAAAAGCFTILDPTGQLRWVPFGS